MSAVESVVYWFSGGQTQYMRLYHCMNHDWFWISLTVSLDLSVAVGYAVIAAHWWKNQRFLPNSPAKRALGTIRNIFLFCGICGYLFIPIKMVWPAWRLYDFFMMALVYNTWRYAWSSKGLTVVYNELGRTGKLAADLARSRDESRRKSTFLNAISHDLRTPLNGLVLHADLAQVGVSVQDMTAVGDALQQIKASARAAAQMLDGLLEFARLDSADEPLHADLIELAPLIQEVVAPLEPEARAKGLHLRIDVPEHLALRTDRTRLSRILMNLLTNAVKFTTRGEVRVAVEPAGRAVEIHVTDTGIGVAPEDRERIFDEFFQVHNHERDRKKGFGLGLAIARQLARQMGGEITLVSGVGSGSRFTVLVPDLDVATLAELAQRSAVRDARGTDGFPVDSAATDTGQLACAVDPATGSVTCARR